MPRWRKGEDTINALLERRHLQRVAADSETAETLVATSERHVQGAATLTNSDPKAASVSPMTQPQRPPHRACSPAEACAHHHRRRPHRHRLGHTAPSSSAVS